MLRWCAAALLLVIATACSKTQSADFAVYDWEAQRARPSAPGARELQCRSSACAGLGDKTINVAGEPRLTDDDLDRDGIHADVDPQVGEPTLRLQLTARGRARFERLTRSLAQRGSRAGAPQHLLLAIDDVVYGAPFVDPQRYPGGLPPDSGIQVSVASPDEARELAKRLGGG